MFERQAARYYDEHGDDYTKFWSEQIHCGLFACTGDLRVAVRAMTSYLADLAKITGGTLLSVGCGQGAADRQLYDQYGLSIHGIDISEGQLNKARRNCPSGRYQNASMQKIPLEDNYFGTVWVQQSLFQSHDKPEAIQEFYRVAKPGGKVVVQDTVLLNEGCLTEVLENFGKRLSVTSLYSPEKLLTSFMSVGFRPTYCEDISEHLIKTYRKVTQQMTKFNQPALYQGFLHSLELVEDGKLGSYIFVLEKNVR